MYWQYEVLFVDDEEYILNSLRRGLEDEEYVCRFALGGKRAIEIMENHKIAVIISDMRMPGMDGLELLKIVKERWPKTVRIVLSGYTQLQQILVTINQADIFSFITKPCSLEDEMMNVIKRALDYYILNEDNERYKKELESKNTIYIDMFKKLSDANTVAKRANECLHILGKELIEHGKTLDYMTYKKNRKLLISKDELFELFSSAIYEQKSDITCEDLTNALTFFISEHFPKVQIKKLCKESTEINTFVKMLEAIIVASFLVFFEENQQEVTAIISFKNESFALYLLANKIESDLEKIEFASNLINGISTKFGINYTAAQVSEKFLISIDIEI